MRTSSNIYTNCVARLYRSIAIRLREAQSRQSDDWTCGFPWECVASTDDAVGRCAECECPGYATRGSTCGGRLRRGILCGGPGSFHEGGLECHDISPGQQQPTRQ